MKKNIKKILRDLLNNIFIFLAYITKTNLTVVGYYQKGISRYGDENITGENFVLENILKNSIKKEKPIMFDVGSNTGAYSLLIKKNFPKAKIYSFEPNIETFNKIIPEATSTDINFYNIGLGSTSGQTIIYDRGNEHGTEHASIYKEVITDIHQVVCVNESIFRSETLDKFCTDNNIEEIDFIKIDTEGSELDILKGAQRMISSKKINFIQFEFNEMNVISKVFLKDFYSLLYNYEIFRINSKKIVPLNEYNTENEIFKYQNFLAISKNNI